MTSNSTHTNVKMKFILALLSFGFLLNGTAQSYFQQKVDYKINVQLYDQENMLRGYEEFTYYNNSTVELTFMYIHLWPNAYKNNETAMSRQLYDMDNMAIQFADEKDLGYIDSLDFKINGQPAKWELDEKNIDICKLTFAAPLKPGEKIVVSTPFKVKIPSGDISRMGFVEESYQITQWYPKPAVFDTDGWHEMPYLTQGEFYSEFGSFDVSITLPKNYVVGATGDLQTASEIEFLEAKAAATEGKYKAGAFEIPKKSGGGYTPCPASDSELKTIRYTQKNVHDFAWFADKRFEVLKGEVTLPNSGRKVTSWAMFTPHQAELWKDAIEYLNDATFYYSKWNGDYPYNHVTALDGTISAGGGMEYPNITVIGNASSKEELEVVIVHEVGHNWFYGLLGSNERDHAWMDEGLNTMNEIRYMQTKYPNNQRMSDMARGMADKLHIENLNHQDMSSFTYATVAGLGLDQPIELHSKDYTNLNYGAIVYSKTGLVFLYLKDYLGDEAFDKAMQAYYEEWHYKHPQPADIKATLERETGKDLSWLFEDLIQTTKQIDYKIQGVNVEENTTVVKIKNNGQIASPVRVDAYSLGQYRETVWLDAGTKKSEATFKGTSYDEFIIDAKRQMPELNRSNNYWTKKGLFHKTEPFKMEFLGGDNEPGVCNSFWLPAIGLNTYDKFMLGAVFHNQTLPKNKFEYTIAPLFSFGRKNLAGFADMNYSWIPAKNVRMVTLGILGKTFGNGLSANLDSSGTAIATYYTIQPYLNLGIGKPAAKSRFKQNLKLQGHYIIENGLGIDNVLMGGTANYELNYKKRRHQVEFKVRLDYFNAENNYGGLSIDSEIMNLGGEVTYAFQYWDEKDKTIEIRAFFGQNLIANGPANRYAFNLGGQTGAQDVTYENYMFGRNQTSGLWANQRIENQGGFKTTSTYGTTNGSLFATNLYIQLPYIKLVGVYADFGLFDNAGTMESASDAGVAIKASKFFGVYFPIYESDNLKNSYPAGTTYGQKIRFTLTLQGFSLSKLMQEVL